MGYDTLSANIELGHKADARSYTVACRILEDLGIHSVRLLTNNPHKVQALEQDGIHVIERVPLIPKSWLAQSPAGNDDDEQVEHVFSDRDAYLVTKIQHMGHLLCIPDRVLDSVVGGVDGLKR
jgi:GTP cyclohydrolase II